MTVHGDSGSAKAILVACGPFMTQTGVGAGGADVSEVEPGFGTFGWGMQGGTINNRLADDFALPGGGCVFHYKWLTYQTSGTTSGTITGMNLNQWSGDPLSGGSVASSGPANSLTSQTWTGVYHVTSTTLSAVNRPILEVDNSAARATGLSPGTYWLDASVTGLLTSGPWGPPVAPHSAADNGRQFLGSAGTECRTAKRPG